MITPTYKLQLTVKINLTDLPALRRFLGNVEGYDNFYVIKKEGNKPDVVVRGDVWFKDMKKGREKKVRNSIEDKGGEIISNFSEDSERFSIKTKKSIRNSFIYFGITYFSSISGIALVGTSMTIPIESVNILVMGLVPGGGAFLTRLALELKLN